jgi:amino acid adenylation domain-containing protein
MAERLSDMTTLQRPPFDLESSLPDRFFAVCDLFPDHTAITEAGTTITYGELRRRVYGIAAAMLDHGVEPGERIAMYHDNATTMITIILATLYIGCTYVPIDPILGKAQIGSVIEGVSPRLVVTSDLTLLPDSFQGGRLLPDMISGLDGAPLSGPLATADSVASILYTSGSTGGRKGVAQNHRNLLFHVSVLTERFAIQADDVHSLAAPFIFDASTTDMYCTLLNGARLVPLDARRRGAKATLEVLRQEDVTLLHATPTLLRSLSSEAQDARLDKLRVTIIGGEPLFFQDIETFRRALSPQCTYVNGYGLTETSGFITLFEVPSSSHKGYRSDGAVPVGQPPAGVRLECSAGSAEENGQGEVTVASRHIALGYWDPASLEVRSFQMDKIDPFARWYATGDNGRWSAAGDLLLSGRIDRQVKVRGYRTDLDQVETAFLSFPDITHAAADVVKGEFELRVFICCMSGNKPDPAAMHEHLNQRLPAYLLPIKIYLLATMPLTVTGKLDRKALPDLEANARMIDAPVASAPGNTTLATLLRVSASLLNLKTVLPDDRFFEIGGDSLTMARLHTEITRLLAIDVPLFRFYEFPTLGMLAEHIDRSREDQTRLRISSIHRRLARRAAAGASDGI